MDTISEIKRFVLRALGRLNGIPWPDDVFEDMARTGVVPEPLLSDVRQAKRELEHDGYIQADRDDFDDQVTWTLTSKGRHKAQQLG